jgi:hypothetical protein
MPLREKPVILPEQAYSRSRRVRHAFWFIRRQAKEGSQSLERTQSKHVGRTYGIEPSLIKRIKAKYRCELSFGEGK